MNIVLDTNIYIAASFNKRSSSAKIIAMVRDNDLQIIWNAPTADEIKAIATKIPPVSWSDFQPLFKPGNQYSGPLDHSNLSIIEDPDDRKFAALARATKATLITNDVHLLAHIENLDISITTPSQFLKNL